MARFFRRNVSKIWFLPSVASAAAPTRAEITAGVDLSGAIAAIAGFSLSNTPIAVPDLSSTFNKTIPGEDATQASTLTFYDDNASTVIRTALAKGTAGYILLEPYGDVATKRCEVWPVQTTGVNDVWDLGNDSARYIVGFAVTNTPTQNAVIP